MVKNSIITFFHNNDKIEIDFSNNTKLSPTTTVLEYLRKSPHHTGTKEGCAEGDCGACTVTLAEVSGNELMYKAVNSCLIFLPYLHGKQLITVENLGNSKQLHPIQQAMYETDASQCGYCTPGFVMSMLPLYKQKTIPAKEEIQIALAGNLCRCTGYRPIVEAAEKISGMNKADIFSENEKTILKELSQMAKNSQSIEIDDNSTQYFLPNDLITSLEIKHQYNFIDVINGSTDIALRHTKKFEHLPTLLDLTRVSELNFIQTEKNKITIGAGVKLEEIRVQLAAVFPALAEMLTVFGSKQIRNMATLGGNIASASPIGDSLPILMAYDAKVNLESVSGKRQIALREFITSYRTTQMLVNELITSVEIPLPAKGKQIKFYKISKRKDLDISTVSVAFELLLDKNKVVEFNAFYGGMSATTKLAQSVQNFLVGKVWSEANILKAQDLIVDDFSPISDARSGAEARLIMAKNLLLKFYLEHK